MSPASRGRSEAESLDGAEASRRIGAVMVGRVVVWRCRRGASVLGGERHAEASGDAREAVAPPAMAERDGDREDVRPLPRRHAIERCPRAP